MSCHHPSIATVSLDAYRSNLALVRRMVGKDTKIIAVVKANAYGHGLIPVSRAALREGASMLGVATVQEAMDVRNAGIEAPLLLMLSPLQEHLPHIIENKLTTIVTDVEIAEALGAAAKEAGCIVPVHCKVDTGMGRQGIPLEDAARTLQYIARTMHIDIQGICTHFANSEVVEDAFTYAQIKDFKSLLKELERLGVPFEFAHAANSGAIVNYRESVFDAVRPGLITYGIWPTDAGDKSPLLQPVLRWETRVVQVRELKPGATVGYGRRYRTNIPMRAAILSVGYADGYRYAFSNRAQVLIHGRRCPVRGAVSMDQIVVDVTETPHVRRGDTAVLIGREGTESISAEELAGLAGTIPYDILTGIGPRVARRYTGDDSAS